MSCVIVISCWPADCIVLAVSHARREQSYWLKRFEERMSIQIKIRVYDPDSRRFREVALMQDFLWK